MMLLFIFNWQEANMEGDRLGGHQYWVELFPRFGAAVIRRQNIASHILWLSHHDFDNQYRCWRRWKRSDAHCRVSWTFSRSLSHSLCSTNQPVPNYFVILRVDTECFFFKYKIILEYLDWSPQKSLSTWTGPPKINECKKTWICDLATFCNKTSHPFHAVHTLLTS